MQFVQIAVNCKQFIIIIRLQLGIDQAFPSQDIASRATESRGESTHVATCNRTRLFVSDCTLAEIDQAVDTWSVGTNVRPVQKSETIFRVGCYLISEGE